MSALTIEGGAAPLSLAEARDWLRLGPAENDAAVAALIRAATNMCEAFTGQMLIVRDVVEERSVAPLLWLSRQPVVAVDDVLLLSGTAAPVAVDWSLVRGDSGAAAVQLAAGTNGPDRVRVRYRAGLADNGNGVPEALRQGLLRLVQHWHFSGQDDAKLPAIVTALWTPWRRSSIGAAR